MIVKGFDENVLYFNTTERPQITSQHVFLFVVKMGGKFMCGKYLKLTGNMPTHLRPKENIRSKFDVLQYQTWKKIAIQRVFDQMLKSSVYLWFYFEGSTTISGLFLR